ncbi:MAG: hypothetical protein COU46_03455 [Candidatus Niyogibacteria bacterium CG10_big_fil_rev_8_21_14_0_10_42_19]|uniref:Peptidase MA-like domain-containing protein n=1 Tax=Candidatus Niyogibacteria bacterium CG10_big_fil_rev_8_21_14_0_10_42_19 TaxID=1974725 RepID=A0A2H0TEW7_9BACT|nr:MAG: hypothetical protein COU46_03455 [Candidatus Niyogibacteria bacterium CG10_big_fil_rev_8_21_14_0_10_42_19]
MHYVLKNKNKSKIDKILSEYIKNVFKANNKKIIENVKKAEKDWRVVEKRYFNLVDKIFKKHPWPNGKYIGFASIFMMYPRDVREKTFLFPGIIYKNTPPVEVVIGHELLHFIFFDYIKKKYNLNIDSKIKGKEDDYLWKVSEVFNSVIEDWDTYYRIFKFKTPPYVAKNFYLKMRRQWSKDQDINMLLGRWLKNK